jgi:hypothetical protein
VTPHGVRGAVLRLKINITPPQREQLTESQSVCKATVIMVRHVHRLPQSGDSLRRT